MQRNNIPERHIRSFDGYHPFRNSMTYRLIPSILTPTCFYGNPYIYEHMTDCGVFWPSSLPSGHTLPLIRSPHYSIHTPLWCPSPQLQYESFIRNRTHSKTLVAEKNIIIITKPEETQEKRRKVDCETKEKANVIKKNKLNNEECKSDISYVEDNKMSTKSKASQQRNNACDEKVGQWVKREATSEMFTNINQVVDKKQFKSKKQCQKMTTTGKVKPQKIIATSKDSILTFEQDELSKRNFSSTLIEELLTSILKDVFFIAEETNDNSYESIVIFESKTKHTNSLQRIQKMPSTNTNDEDKSSPKKQDYLTKSLKRPAKCDEEQLVSPSIRFIPPQLQKAKKTLAVTSSTGSPIEEEIHSSSSDSSGSRKQISKIAPSLNSRYSSPSSEKLSSSSLETSSGSESQETTELSICSTPENISTIVNRRTPDSRNKPWKRSINYEYRLENPGSANSSPNSSYCTPESSPSDWGSAVKRQRTSWNDSYNNLNDSFNSEYLSESSRSCDSSGAIQPELIGYQMVGDSQFCRFGQQILGLRRVSMPNCPGRIGICVSGQTISDLHRRVKEKFYPISDKIILMIGTNDFLRNVDVTTMCHELSELVKTLQESASNIVLLTLPPIPKLEKKHSIQHFMMLDKYNSYIRSLEDGDKIRIADVSPLYMSTPPYQRCRMQLFEIYFGGPARRHDLIHLNRQGLEVIRNYILDKLL